MNSGGATNALSHFECDPFDLLGNAPYSNPPKSSPEKGEKSRREQQIFNCRKQWIFDDGSLENQRQLPKCLLDFECDPFDLLGNAPYSNPPKSSPEKGEKSRREQQIFNCRKQWIFDDGSLENQRQLSKCLLDFECSLLRPLEYICIFNFVARNFPQGVISSATPSTSWVMLHSINFVQLIITACGANVNSLQVGKCQWGVSAMNVCVFCMTSCRVARSCKTSPVSRE